MLPLAADELDERLALEYADDAEAWLVEDPYLLADDDDDMGSLLVELGLKYELVPVDPEPPDDVEVNDSDDSVELMEPELGLESEPRRWAWPRVA